MEPVDALRKLHIWLPEHPALAHMVDERPHRHVDDKRTCERTVLKSRVDPHAIGEVAERHSVWRGRGRHCSGATRKTRDRKRPRAWSWCATWPAKPLTAVAGLPHRRHKVASRLTQRDVVDQPSPIWALGSLHRQASQARPLFYRADLMCGATRQASARYADRHIDSLG